MVPKRIAQALDGDGKPTVRNLAEALEALIRLGCDLDAGRIWFEVIPEASLRPRTWDYYFSFCVSDPKSRWDPGPYSQLATLSLKGDLIRPTDTRFNHIEVTLSARQGMMNESRETSFRTIGSLSSSDDALYAYVFIPAEFVPELASVAQSGRICAVRLLGSRLRYRSASLVGLSLTTDDEEDEKADEKFKAEAA